MKHSYAMVFHIYQHDGKRTIGRPDSGTLVSHTWAEVERRLPSKDAIESLKKGAAQACDMLALSEPE